MRRILLALFGLLLLSAEGVFNRVLHLEIMRPDLAVLLVLFAALRLGPLDGALLAFLFGLLQDSFSGAPTGLSPIVYLVIWLLVRFGRGFLMANQLPVQLGVVLVACLASAGLQVLFLSLGSMGSGSLVLLLTYALPLALVQALLALPMWALARRICGLSRDPTLVARA